MSKRILKSKRMALVIALALALTMSLGLMGGGAYAAPVGVTYSSYVITPYSNPANPVNDQHAYIDFTYPGVLSGVNDLPDGTFTVLLAGRNVETDQTYQRTLTWSGDGTNTLRLDLGAYVAGSTPAATAQFSGVISISTSGLYKATSAGVALDEITNFSTIMPSGATATLSAPITGSATITVTNVPQVRGIVAIGVYSENSNGELVPIGDPNTDITNQPTWQNNVEAYIAHFPNFDQYSPANDTGHATAQILDALTNSGSPYDGTAPALLDANVKVVSDADSQLTFYVPNTITGDVHVYIVDDNLFKAVSAQLGYSFTYADLIAANGVLPIVP